MSEPVFTRYLRTAAAYETDAAHHHYVELMEVSTPAIHLLTAHSICKLARNFMGSFYGKHYVLMVEIRK